MNSDILVGLETLIEEKRADRGMEIRSSVWPFFKSISVMHNRLVHTKFDWASEEIFVATYLDFLGVISRLSRYILGYKKEEWEIG